MIPSPAASFGYVGTSMPPPVLPSIDVRTPGDGTVLPSEKGTKLSKKSSTYEPRTSFIPFPTSTSKPTYLEVKILNPGSGTGAWGPAAAVGVGWGDIASHNYRRMPGWDPALIGMHSDDGKLFEGSDNGAAAKVVSSIWHSASQVAGVGVLPPSPGNPHYRLVFTLNGGLVTERPLGTSFNASKMCFAIGMLGINVEVSINHAHAPFLYAPANDLPGASKPIAVIDAPVIGPGDRGTGRPSPVPVNELAALRTRIAALEALARPVDTSTYRTMRDDEVDAAIASVEASLAALRSEKGRRVAGPVAAITSNAVVCVEARKHGVEVMSVAWEDTGRTKGSCFGPNISDMTLHAEERDMPIIRKPNFADVTSDHDIDLFYLVVGNEKAGGVKTSITLREYLMDVSKYTSNPRIPSLYVAARDSKVLVASQACILPLRDGKVEFNVRLYNYQSMSEPAVLVIVASSEGTSAQVVMGRSNRLRFNKEGQAADFVAERLSDDRAKRGVAVEGAMTEEEQKRNCLLIIQVPLKVSAPRYDDYAIGPMPCAPKSIGYAIGGGAGAVAMCASSASVAPVSRGIEAAMLSTSAAREPFTGTQGLKMERDPTMPIRVTLQHYHVTDTAAIPAPAMAAIAKQVTELYDAAAPWNRGSLVTEGPTGRTTETTGAIGGAGRGPIPPPWYWGFYLPPRVVPVDPFAHLPLPLHNPLLMPSD